MTNTLINMTLTTTLTTTRTLTTLGDASDDQCDVVVPVSVVDEHPACRDEVGAEIGVGVVDETLRASDGRTQEPSRPG